MRLFPQTLANCVVVNGLNLYSIHYCNVLEHVSMYIVHGAGTGSRKPGLKLING